MDEKKVTRHRKKPGMLRRLAYGSILERVHNLGAASDVAVIKTAKQSDLVRNLAFAIHQQKLWGALDRLKRQNPYMLPIPPRVEKIRLQAALKSQLGES